jgi:hypothetical protein
VFLAFPNQAAHFLLPCVECSYAREYHYKCAPPSTRLFAHCTKIAQHETYGTDPFFFLPSVLNDRAVSVMRRMSHKLTGRDGAPGSAASAATSANNNKTAHPVSPTQSNKTHEDVENSVPDKVEAQVQRLILAATSHENLCESYIGWCPFW